ncbi:demethoxyubiquinone hydroxylase family protein [Sphingomonas sp. PB4P5]|uniref:demethoxyubiquinone hydroxylase family protein n=1 Tax=Parasphingomonas puruogangriensis TaxID=3096155 RepID=UPI002FCA0EF5
MTRWKPGDPKRVSAPMVRVDQAGEYGAIRIYGGQLAVMGDRIPAAREIAGMAVQEERHRAFFDAMMARRGVRPTLLQPAWKLAGFALGAVTAAISPAAAMACTVAVETEIDKHYADQLVALGDSDPELSAAILDFQAEEVEHRETALAAGAETAIGYPILSAVIRLGCRVAIATAQRI